MSTRHHGRRWLADNRALRAIIAVLVVALSISVASVGAAAPAAAAINVPFTARFAANTNGDIIIRGNQLLNCPTTAATCAAGRTGSGTGDAINNNGYAMTFVDVDSNSATRSSSSSTITIPTTSSVLFAGLYWSGYITAGTSGAAPPAGTAQNRLLLQIPGESTYRTITASQVMNAAGTGGVGSYQSFADVTSLVSGARSGVYTAADIYAGTGIDRYGAWSLVIAYGDPNLPSRNLSIYDGYGVIRNATGDTTATIPVNGFVTPSSAPFTTRMGAVVYEGDAGYTGDQITITRQDGTQLALSNSLNPLDNSFNSTMSDNGVAITGRNPQQANMFGYDADVFQGQLLNPGDRSATLAFRTGGETYFPGVMTFATDIFAPTLQTTKTQTLIDVNGDGTASIGDRIQYDITVTNTGRDASVATVLDDPLPQGTTYVPGTLTIDGVAITSAADGDRGELIDGAISARLGTSPGTTGGRLEVGATTRLQFSVEIGAALADGTTIVNRAVLRFNSAQTGTALSSTSNIVSMQFTAPRSHLRVSKSADAAVIQRDGSRLLTYTIRVINDGPQPDSGATLTDTLPAGFTATSVTGPGCAPVSGSTLTCAVGALAVGQTAIVTVSGTVAADAPTTLTNSAVATGSSVDPNPGVPGTATTIVNSPPVAVNDVGQVAGGTGNTVTIPLLANDSDPDGNPLTVTSVTSVGAAHGTVAINADGTLTYTVTDPAFKGVDTYFYRVCDTNGGCATATIDITVANQAPVAAADFETTPPGTPVTVPVLANDSDPNGDPLTVTVPAQPTGGTATVNADGSITVTPNAGFAGDIVVTYQVCDPDGACTTATLTVTVANDPPKAVDDSFTTPFQTPITISSSQVLANDTDGNNEPLTVVAVQTGDVTGGSVTWSPGGDIVFTPAPGFTGQAQFTYTITDGTTRTGATIFVTVPNTPPTAADTTVTTVGPVPVSIPISGLVGDAQTPDQLAVTIVSQPTNGSVQIVDGQIVYQADPSFKGSETISYQVCDPQGLCATATITVVVANDPPVAADNARTIAPGQTISVPVLLNDIDPNGDTLTLTRIVAGPGAGLGTARIDAATGQIIYTPAPGQTAPATITYETCDNDPVDPQCDTADLVVTIVNTAPIARNDSRFTFHTAGQPTTVPIAVLDNDIEPDGEPLTITGISQPVVGTATLIEDATAPGGFRIDYTAPAGFVGEVTFSYSVADPSGGSANAVVVVTIGNRTPAPVADTATAPGGVATSHDVLANDTDPDGDAITVRLDGSPSAGTAQIVNNQISYTPPLAAGVYTVPYLACDTYNLCTPSLLTVTVDNLPPDAVDDSFTTPFGTPIDIPAAQLLVNDSDPNATPPTVVSVQDAVNGTVILVDGVVTFTPSPGFVGTATFTYTITDGTSESTATVTITVPNTAPVANDDQAGTPTNTPVTVPILANDSDAETANADLAVSIVSGPDAAAGTATIIAGADGPQLLFTPAAGFSGTVTITYEVCDDAPGALQLCSTATLTIVVDDAAPVAVDDVTRTPYQTPVVLADADLLANDSDLNGDPLSIVTVQNPVNGTVVRDPATGQITFTPAPGFTGRASFQYSITDGDALSTATVFIDVPNTPPNAADDTAETVTGRPVTIDVLANDSDAETANADLALAVIGASVGTAEVVNGQILYTPPAGFFGTATVVYEITDAHGLTARAVVTITVSAPPVAVDDSFTTPFQTPVTLSDALLLSNDTDPDTGTLQVQSVQDAQGGTVTRDAATGEIAFTPADGFYGTASFTYTITDGTSVSTATVTITVPNTAPQAFDDQAGTPTNTPVTVPILANDSDAETATADLTVQILSGPTPAQGTAELVAGPIGQQLLFTPADSFSGTVTITYTICDDAPADLRRCDTATVTITVDDAAPVAVDDNAQTPIDTPVTFTPSDLLANDVDLNGDTLTITEVGGATNGSVVRDEATGAITFTPAPGFVGTASFTYTITDGEATSTATVFITVVAGPPVAVDDEAATEIDTAVTVDVVANDSAGDGGQLVLTNIGAFDGGTAVISGNQVVVTPDPGFTGTLQVPYTVCQADGRCATAVAVVTVTDPNPPTEPPTTEPPTTDAPSTEAPTTPGIPTPSGPEPSATDGPTSVRGVQVPPSSGGVDGGIQMPSTGAQVTGAILGAGVLVLVGAVLLVLRRRRSQ